ncbi:MAG: (2Fe-2S) ferredoxin domain-containing protein [Thermomicrobiales bacterium]|nr:(2Fe-2S) ferredoxin domain-containing protein [Thermomicrobiales bacterium]
MYWADHHVLACTASHCAQRGANDVIMKLRREVMKRGLGHRLFVNTCGSIDLCDIGPNLLIYPDDVIYSGVTPQDIPEIVDALERGEIVERLRLTPDTPAEAARRAFYAAAVEPGPSRPAAEFEALAATMDLDAAWIAEQQRRGFIARKPGPDGGPETIAVTTKARDRYGV